ncbi:LAGLIDADG family homing endonuclease [Actinomadura gamaensis]|uniref:Homing endonuclease LAGLIDADG domain-containing protein n=1 Tax=Actinomadura gamaensis TaxID=1763541 RepID=A0ABV9U0L9_9ACTN
MSESECSERNCDKAARTRGMCALHYGRWIRATPRRLRPPSIREERSRRPDITHALGVFDPTRPEMAYLLGFLQADGNHRRAGPGKGLVSVELTARDIDLLKAFQRLVPYRSSISTRSRETNFSNGVHTSAVWSFGAAEARHALEALGLPPGKKSAVIGPPKVPFSEPDYVRALVDADGSVGFTGRGYPFVSFTTASPVMSGYVCDKVFEVTGVRRTVRPNGRDGVYNLLVTSDPAAELARWLYYEGCLALERKYAKAVEVAGWVRPEGMRARSSPRRWTPQEDEVVLAMTTPEAAEVLGRTEKSVAIRRVRLRKGVTARVPYR